MIPRLFLDPEDFVACLAGFGRIWKGGIVQSGRSAAIKERTVQFFEFLFPPQKARPEVDVIFRIPYRGEGFPEDVPKTHPVDPLLSAAEDPLERGREGWVEIDTGRDFSL
jgi:hypothetical protein